MSKTSGIEIQCHRTVGGSSVTACYAIDEGADPSVYHLSVSIDGNTKITINPGHENTLVGGMLDGLRFGSAVAKCISDLLTVLDTLGIVVSLPPEEASELALLLRESKDS